MPQRKNAVKQLKVDTRRKAENNLRKKKMKEAQKEAVKKGGTEAVNKAYKAIDKASAKGSIHKNKAARLKSNLAKKTKA